MRAVEIIPATTISERLLRDRFEQPLESHHPWSTPQASSQKTNLIFIPLYDRTESLCSMEVHHFPRANMGNIRNLVQEIIEIRERRHSSLPTAELSIRLLILESAYKDQDKSKTEVLKYFPISLVACMESYFRLAIKELIDSEGPFVENSAKLNTNMRFDFDLAKALHGKKVTLGEIVSHLVPLNSLNNIASHMSVILGSDFLEAVGTIHDRWATEVHKKPKQPILANKGETYHHVTKTFELRHIFCHETATKHEFTATDIDQCFEHTILFMKASDEVISETLHPNSPLTQTDMNIHAALEYQNEHSTLVKLAEEVLRKLDSARGHEFLRVQEAWEAFMNQSADFEGNEYRGGTISSAIRSTAATRFTRERISQIKSFLQHLSNHD